MKVLMVARWPAGGIKTFFRYIYGCDCFSDLELTLIGPDLNLADFLEVNLPAGRIELVACENNNKSLISVTRRELKKDYDLVHSHGFSAGFLTAIAKYGRKIPHLMTAHDVFLSGQFSGIKGRCKQYLMNTIFNRIDAIHTVTKDAEKNLLEYMPRLDSKNIHSILHGVDTEYFRDGEPRDIRGEIGLSKDVCMVGFFGRFMAQKGFRNLVRAVKIIVDNKMLNQDLKVCTFGWGGFIREDYEYIEQQGLKEYFIQMPETHNMPGSIKAFDVVAMPSRWEACGLLAMEVLACGTPMVGTSCIGLREVIEGTPSAVIEPENSQQLADSIVELLKPSAKDVFEKFVPTACDRFAIARPANGLRELYSELVH